MRLRLYGKVPLPETSTSHTDMKRVTAAHVKFLVSSPFIHHAVSWCSVACIQRHQQYHLNYMHSAYTLTWHRSHKNNPDKAVDIFCDRASYHASGPWKEQLDWVNLSGKEMKWRQNNNIKMASGRSDMKKKKKKSKGVGNETEENKENDHVIPVVLDFT